ADGAYTVSWAAVSGATGYQLEQKIGSGAWASIYTGTAPSKAVSGLSTNTYQYRVKAKYESLSGGYRTSSVTTVLLSPSIPASIATPTSTVTNGRYTISWAQVVTATIYTLQESVNNGVWSNLASQEDISFDHVVNTDGSYQYRVNACNASGCSDWKVSSTVTVTLPPAWRQTKQITVTDAGGSDSEPSQTVDLSTAALKGQASVSGGQASYQIPIDLPPGRGGIQPKVSLSYNSQSGNGVAGVGWSLNAGSGISRCGATYAQDGFTRSVTFNANTDRLCFNGQRLITSGTYGTSGTEYRTEMDSFVKVIQSGGINSSSTNFTVHRPDGSTATYGANANSRFAPVGLATTLNWKVTQESWAGGNNTIDYEYDTSVAGEHLLSKIYYTGSAGTEGDRVVEFKYENRNDTRLSYLAGGKLVTERRLKQINTQYGSDIVSKYSITYKSSNASSRSLLDSVQQCGYKTGIESCTKNTNLNWSSNNQDILTKTAPLTIGEQQVFQDKVKIHEFQPHGDVDGDGTVDFPDYFTNAEQELKGTHGFTSEKTCHYEYAMGRYNCSTFDLDLDGKIDVHTSINGQLWIDFSDDTLSFQSTGLSYTPSDSKNIIIGASDIDGDGLIDLVLKEYDSGDDVWRVYFNQSNYQKVAANKIFTESQELFRAPKASSGNIFRSTKSLSLVGDIDGNGLTDFLVSYVGGNQLGSVPVARLSHFLLNESSPANFQHSSLLAPSLLVNSNQSEMSFFHMMADINGDSLPDIIAWQHNSSGRQLGYLLNIGGAFESWIEFGGDVELKTRQHAIALGPVESFDIYYPKFFNSIQFADIDLDGTSEMMLPGERLITACAKVGEPIAGFKTRCGDALYKDIRTSSTADFPTTAINTADYDDSIYRYDAIKFVLQSNGGYALTRSSSDFIGSAHQARFMDLFGDGLIDLLTTYGPRRTAGNNVHWIQDPSSSMWGENYGAYMTRNFGSGNAQTNSDYKSVDYLQSVTDGIGNQSSWRYRPLSTGEASAGQTKMYQTDHEYVGDGYIHFGSSMYVVQSFEQSNGIGGTNETEYAYKGAIYNLQGRGFTGFREIIEKDVARNKTTQTVFKQKFPQVGLLESQTVKVAGTTVATTTQAWADNPQHSFTGVYHNINTNTLTHSYGLSGASEQRSSVEQTVDLAGVDEHGNIGKRTKIVTDFVDGGANRYQSVIETDFTADLDNWFLRKFASKKTTTNVTERGWANDPYLTADTEQWQLLTINAWHSAHHQPTNVSYTAKGSNCDRVEATTFNEYGLPTEVSVTGQTSSCGALTARTTSFTYTKDGTSQADDGYLPYQVTNAKNHLTTTEYNMGLGVPTKVTAPNSIITETEYDAIGRPVQLSQTGSPIKYIRYLLAASGSHAPSHAHLLTRSTSAGMPTQEVYLDSLGRSLRSATQAFDGSNYQYLDKRYDSLGHLTHESLPYFSGDTAEFTVFSDFDAFDRPRARSLPNGESGGLISTYDYSGLKTDITVGSRTMSRTYGMQGLLYETIDADDNSNRFAYDGAGRPLVIQDANEQQIVASYNGFGHKTQVVDPNQGTTIFGYNTLGELDKQTDANLVTQTFALDTLGRITTKAITGSNADGSASYTWDTLKQGMLSSESQNGITRSYTYTNALQLATSSVQVASSAGGDNVTRTISHQYDGFYGRPKGLTYPNGLTLEYRYNNSGYLNQTRNAASGYIYRTVTDMDAAGHVTGSQMANTLLEQTSRYNSEGTMANTQVSSNLGVLHSHYYDHYDSFMNLTDERNAITGLEKHYEYDNLNRLEQYSFSNAGFALYDSVTPFAATVDYGYDAVGNLLKKTDYSRNTANAYEYNSSCASNSNAGPNAVCAITKLNGTKIQFRYDRRGNLVSGDGLTMTYNALDKPLSIIGRGPGSNTSTGFVYGSDNMRALQTRTVSGTTTKTHYVDKLFESDNDGSWRAYIGDIAVLSYTPERSHQLLYTLRDRLGSATTMVDHQGNIITQRYFDPFGRTASASVAGSLGDLVDTNRNRRGFTDHEHLNEQQLIHMNGRVYDYNMGRFMSVDPFIQSPTSTQSVNPYSYIMNNPLSGTDPTGYEAEPELEKIEYTKETEKVSVTGSHLKRSVTTGVSGTAFSNGSTQSFSAKISGGQITSATIGSLQSVSNKDSTQTQNEGGTQKVDFAQKAIDTYESIGAGNFLSGASTAGAAADLAFSGNSLVSTKGAATALFATGATMNEWTTIRGASQSAGSYSLNNIGTMGKIIGGITGWAILGHSFASNFYNVDQGHISTSEGITKFFLDIAAIKAGTSSPYGLAAATVYGVVDMNYSKDRNVTGIIQLKRDVVKHFENRYAHPENQLPYTQNPFNLFPKF
ncbi:hypothetical protein G3R48_08830, partial [Shewanella intestini]